MRYCCTPEMKCLQFNCLLACWLAGLLACWHPANDPASNPVSNPRSDPASSPASDRASNPASNQANHPASNPISNVQKGSRTSYFCSAATDGTSHSTTDRRELDNSTPPERPDVTYATPMPTIRDITAKTNRTNHRKSFKHEAQNLQKCVQNRVHEAPKSILRANLLQNTIWDRIWMPFGRLLGSPGRPLGHNFGIILTSVFEDRFRYLSEAQFSSIWGAFWLRFRCHFRSHL